MKSTKFLRLVCPRCGTGAVACSKSSYELKCPHCRYLLTQSAGGKAKLRAHVKEVLWS